MKKNQLAIPLLMTASLASVVALNLSCGKKTPSTATSPTVPEIPATNLPSADAVPTNSPITTNATSLMAVNPPATLNAASSSAPAAPAEITNPPVAATAPVAPATPEIAPTAPAEKPVVKTVEMPTTVPAAPAEFYSRDFTNQPIAIAKSKKSDSHLNLRLGYSHVGYGNSRDTVYGGVKFYFEPDALREKAGKNAWLLPNTSAELVHQYLPKPDKSGSGSTPGLQLRANAYWPWAKWTCDSLTRENCSCSYAQPLHFTAGPTVTAGFDRTFEGSGFRFARYAGVRLAVNRYAFVEYALGRIDGLGRNRQQLIAELPIYSSHDGDVRYALRGEWSRGDRNLPDYFQLGAYIEMPLELALRPRDWREKK